MNVYRFRSVERLLGESQELEKQEIYFASPDQLNDPMEGFRDIFWQGDEIVWDNFFKQYAYCLLRTYIDLKIIGKDTTRAELESRIPVMERRDRFGKVEPSDQSERLVDLFNDICDRVFEKDELDECIVKIANVKRKARYDAVLFYLQNVHFVALTEIQKTLVKRGLTPENEQFFAESPFGLRRLKEGKFFEFMQKTENEEFFDSSFPAVNESISDLFLTYKFHYHSKSQNTFGENRQLVILDFPKVYLKQLVTNLLYPRWYAACFTKDYKNSSVWGHYGDGHKGVCLIFEMESTDERNSLTLNQITSDGGNGEHWEPVSHPFYEINYQDKAGEIDFFRSIGRLPRPDLMASWYSDQNGNLSEYAAHIGLGGDEGAWRKRYWDDFPRDIIIKTKDWEYEREIRLILTSMLSNLDDKRQRTLTYDFNSLKGIIFGINTSDSDKLNITEIIERKCRQNDRTEFKFYQAYYSPKNGDIRKREIRPLSRMFENMNSVVP